MWVTPASTLLIHGADGGQRRPTEPGGSVLREDPMKRILILTIATLAVAATVASAQTPPTTSPAPATPAAGAAFVDADGDGICDNFQGGKRGAGTGTAQAKRGNRYGPGDGTGNQGVGPRDGSGYGPGAKSGNCTGSGPKGRGPRR